MQKQIGSILLIAGTCVGSGMIALPMVLAKIGLIPSVITMIVVWAVMYYTSLMNLELNLQAGKGLPLGSLAKLFSGSGAEIVGTLSYKLLSYALLSVFLYGGASVLQKLLISSMGIEYSVQMIATFCAIIATLVLLVPIKVIDYMNRVLFSGKIFIFSTLIIGMILMIDWSHIPLISDKVFELSQWCAVLPILFTSFGFQVIFHTLTNYCNKDAKMLKKVFLWGTILPTIIYIIWTGGLLSVLYHHSPDFYTKMANGKVEVGDLVKELSSVSQWTFVQLFIWWISILSMVATILSVGTGLKESLYEILSKNIQSSKARNGLSALMTILPAYLVALLVPNAFISVLGFASIILAVIAILLPVYLFYKMKKQKLYYPELRHSWLTSLSVAVGCIIILCEIVNMLR